VRIEPRTQPRPLGRKARLTWRSVGLKRAWKRAVVDEVTMD
jgi:hypothetical protein